MGINEPLSAKIRFLFHIGDQYKDSNNKRVNRD